MTAEMHLFCCRKSRALCGERLDGPLGTESEDVDCDPCMDVDEAGRVCGAWLCGLRSWWRGWRPW